MFFSKPEKKVVVLGCGLAGLAALTALKNEFGRKISLVAVDITDMVTLYPALRSYLGGYRRAQDVTYSLSSVLPRGVTFVQDRVVSLDPAHQRVVCEHHELSYDALVVALGGKPDFNNIPVDTRLVFTLDSASDVTALREHVMQLLKPLEKKRSLEPYKKDLTCVVVGGSAAGVELALSCVSFFRDLCRSCKISSSLIDVTLVTQGILLDGTSENVQQHVRDLLQSRHIETIEQNNVVRIDDGRVYLHDGRSLASSTILWESGRVPRFLHSQLGKNGVAVGASLQSSSFPDVFGIGDCVSQSLELHHQAEVVATNVSAYLFSGHVVPFISSKDSSLMLRLGKEGLVIDGSVIKTGWSATRAIRHYEKSFVGGIL